MNRILIIEDEKSIQRMIEYDLVQLGYKVDSAMDGLEGYNKALAKHYDVILLDLMLPSMNGMKVCQKLREQKIESYIIMLTAIDDEKNVIKGLEIGADDYITKPFSPLELAARIKVGIRRRSKTVQEDILTYQGITINQKSHEVYNNQQKLELTAKEFELLVYFISNKGIALTRNQLLTDLWGFKYDGDTRVVDVHVFKLREKIDPEANWIKTIRGVGYKLI